MLLLTLPIRSVNRHIIPLFYKFLQAETEDTREEGRKAFSAELEKLASLFERAQSEGFTGPGLWFGDDLGLADVMVAPWLFRSTNVLAHYRQFEQPANEKYRAYLAKLIAHEAVANTSSTEKLYLGATACRYADLILTQFTDSYARYAENRPMTSQVGEATKSGGMLP